MTPGNDERRPWQDGGSSNERLAATSDDTRPRRHKPSPTPVIASTALVVAGTGTQRFVATYRCPGCGCTHLAHLRGDLPASAQRKTACGRLVVTLLPALSGRLAGAA